MTVLTATQAVDAVSKLIDDAWAAAPATSSVSMFFGDVVSDRPGEDGVTTNPEGYAILFTVPVASPQSTQGRRRYETTHLVTVRIFTPFGDGGALSRTYEQVLLNLFRQHVGGTGGYHFFDIEAARIGQHGSWLERSVEASYRFIETP